GVAGSRFSLLALALTGAEGCLAGAKLFRWYAQQRFAARAGKAWIAPALAAWVAVGLLAEWRGRIAVAADAEDVAGRNVQPARPPPVEPPGSAAEPKVEPVAEQTPPPPPAPPPPPEPPWAKLTLADVDKLDFRVPPDHGIVT